MKFKILTLILIVFAIGAMAQEKEPKKKLTKEEKKELKAQQEAETRQLVTAMVKSRQFVLEAYQLRNKQGQTVNVSSSINFIMVDTTEATFQFGSANAVGINGVGGVTIEGDITRWEETFREKSGSYFIRININSTLGFFDITLNIGSYGNVDATVTTMQGGQLNYSGKLISLHESSIFKGFAY